MAKNMKFHAIAIGIISVIVVILYLLIGPAPVQQVAHNPSDRFIRIGNATWGMSCNQQIDHAQQNLEAAPLAKDADGKVIRVEPLKRIAFNNVQTVVKQSCEGQMQCSIYATDDTLGFSLPAGCNKALNVNYRCSDVDRLVTVNTDQGQFLKIDCTPNAATPAPHQP